MDDDGTLTSHMGRIVEAGAVEYGVLPYEIDGGHVDFAKGVIQEALNEKTAQALCEEVHPTRWEFQKTPGTTCTECDLAVRELKALILGE